MQVRILSPVPSMIKQQTPEEVLHDAILKGFTHTTARKPGAVIERLGPERRKILEQLTSDDLAKLRPDACS